MNLSFPIEITHPIWLLPQIICPTCGELNAASHGVIEALEQGPADIYCGACEEKAPREDWELVG